MEAIRLFTSLNREQRNTFLACFLGWSLDAFDFFLLTFVIVPMAHDFGTTIADLGYAITLTLALRPVGAFIFGLLGDRFGRRIPLMIDIIFYSLMELLTAFAPNYTLLLVFRALYGIGMGGEWGLGASLAMESLPAQARGLFSGILQQGYMFGYLFAALVYGIVFPLFGWRALFVVGALPALLVIYIRARVPESPAWLRQRHVLSEAEGSTTNFWPNLAATLKRHWLAVHLCDFAHDRVQRHVARHSGHVSNVSWPAARARRIAKINHRNHLRHRCDLRRNCGRPLFAKIRAPAFDHCHCDLWNHLDSSFGYSRRQYRRW